MQVIKSTTNEHSFFITPEVKSVFDVWLCRFIETNSGNVFDYFGNTTDKGNYFQLDILDSESHLTEGSTYVLEVYDISTFRLAYRCLVKNISSNSVSEEYSNNFETL